MTRTRTERIRPSTEMTRTRAEIMRPSTGLTRTRAELTRPSTEGTCIEGGDVHRCRAGSEPGPFKEWRGFADPAGPRGRGDRRVRRGHRSAPRRRRPPHADPP